MVRAAESALIKVHQKCSRASYLLGPISALGSKVDGPEQCVRREHNGRSSVELRNSTRPNH